MLSDISDDMGRAETLLARGDVVRDTHAALWGSNYAELVTVQDGELCVLAVYKPRRGERPLWDFPDGTLCYREMLAYHVSQALGWNLVPPTLLREGPHGLGSLQLFIAHYSGISYFNLDGRFAGQLRRFALFDYMVNNADRKGGHVLLDASGKLWGIDHGLTFHAAPKLRTVIWEYAGQPVPEELLADVESLRVQLTSGESRLRALLDSYLMPREIVSLAWRVEQVLQTRQFPLPGSGMVYPWPPV